MRCMKQGVLKIELEGRGVTYAALAKAVGVNRSTVLRWACGLVPAERVAAVERLTGIPRETLRPDIFKERAGA